MASKMKRLFSKLRTKSGIKSSISGENEILDEVGIQEEALPRVPRISVTLGPLVDTTGYRVTAPQRLDSDASESIDYEMSPDVTSDSNRSKSMDCDSNSQFTRGASQGSHIRHYSLSSGIEINRTSNRADQKTGKSKMKSQGFQLEYNFDAPKKTTPLSNPLSTPLDLIRGAIADVKIPGPIISKFQKTSKNEIDESPNYYAPKRHLRKSISLGNGDFSFLLEAAKESYTECEIGEAKSNIKDSWNTMVAKAEDGYDTTPENTPSRPRHRRISQDDMSLPVDFAAKLLY